ncbi:MAG: adenosylcobinamide-GDP ribazoletransferase [bacterium]
MRAFFLALTFLSVIPVPSSFWKGEERIERTLQWFPVAGAIIGGLTFLFYYLVSHLLSAKVSFVFSLFFYHLLNGGLHLDGLADFSDACFGAKKNESRFREILKDSRIGAMGVLALLFYFLTIYAAFESISVTPSFFITLGMSGRTAIVIFATMSKSLFSDGLGRLFIERSGKRELFIALGSYFIVLAFLGESFFLTGFVVLLCSFVFKRYIIRRFGGFSGDIFGAGCSLVEILTVLLLAGLRLS